MKSRLLPAFLALVSLAPAAPVATENFDQIPDAFIWKIHGATVQGGKLLLNATGDETSFVNAVLEARKPMPQLNFSRVPLTLTFTDVELGGLAPPEKQAFVVLLGSDRASETAAASYVRVCVNGDGKVILSVAGEKKDGRNMDRPILNRPVAFPIRQLSLTLDRQGYELKITDAVAPMTATGKWIDEIDWTAWESAAPVLIVKAVRRPSPGTTEVTLGSFTIETK